jgi:hypothetical protein
LPNLDFHFDNAIAALQAGRKEWFGSWPTDRRSVGGRFENFIFCKGEHLTILTRTFLAELCENAGFCEMAEVAPGMTGYPNIFTNEILGLEPNSPPDLPSTIVVEARKPS